MKKLFGILSLSVLLFSTLVQSITYANEVENEAIEILNSTLENAMNGLNNSKLNNELIQVQEQNVLSDIEIFNPYTEDFNPHIIHNEDEGIITIYTGDYSYGITIQDKNLGAAKVGDNGNYYKGGYNIPIVVEDKDDTEYGNENSWGGGSDNEGNNYGYDKINHVVTNATNRKGPCPEGYHVPSRGEWIELVNIYNIIKNDEGVFYKDLKLPLAGHVHIPWGQIQWERSAGSYHSSSFARISNGDVNYNNTVFGSNYIRTYETSNISQHGESMRCFKNTYENYRNPDQITYNPNGGAFSGMEKDETITYVYQYVGEKLKPIYNIQIPNRISEDMSQQSGWMFAGWYTKDGTNDDWGEEFDISNPQTTITYAKWLPFNDLKISIGNFELTIMDRNIGAKENSEGKHYSYNEGYEDENMLGFHFQRGNNYGFNVFLGIKSSLKKMPGQYYGSNNNFYNNEFIQSENDGILDRSEEGNPNLWGGNKINNTDYDRKGPCPEGYHVPNSNEWNVIYNMLTKNENSECFGNKYTVGECIASKLKLPYAGIVSYIGTAGPKLYFAGNEGYYWSSSPDPYSTRSKFFYIEGGFVEPNAVHYGYTHGRNSGMSVRCIKNNSKTNKINFKVDNREYDTKNILWREPVTESYIPNEPTKDNAEFKGWKIDGSDSMFQFGEETYIEEDINLSAVFACNNGYSKSKEGYDCIKIGLNYDANGGIFNGGEEIKRVESTLLEIPSVSKTSHTPNYKDDGNFIEEYEGVQIDNPGTLIDNGGYIGKYGTNNVLYYKSEDDFTDVIEFDEYNEKDQFYIDLKYGYALGSYCTKIAIRTGNHPEYTYSKNQETAIYKNESIYSYTEFETGFDVNSNNITVSFYNTCPSLGYYLNFSKKTRYEIEFDIDQINNVGEPTKLGHEFLGWYEENSETPFDFTNKSITEDKTLYAKWKTLEEKAEETTKENVVYTNTTTVTVGDETTEETLSGSTTLTLVSKEVESNEVKKEEGTTKVQESEIKVTSDKTIEYEGGLEVYLEKTEDTGTEVITGKIEGTIKFSAPVAVKIPVSSDVEYVKVQVKHGDEDFGFKGLTLNPVNECNNGEAVNDKYIGENVSVKNNNGGKYATIYTCSASTFVAYTENTKPTNNTISVSSPAAGGGRIVTSTKNENNISKQEHNSADTEKAEVEETTTKTTDTQTIQEQVNKIQQRSLTRGEIAVMTNILLEVYPQLKNTHQELNEVTYACSNYVDEQNFTKEEKRAITRLCKLSIMGIHNNTDKPLDEFMVNQTTTNDEFAKVINRTIENYNEKDFSVVKEALRKLEGDEENVVFGTVYDVFMGIKNIFN